MLPIIQKSIALYKRWDGYKNHFPKKSRYTLGVKIDSLFLDTLELMFVGSYLGPKEKLPLLERANGKLDLLKFFLQISWEMKALDGEKYISLSESLQEVGRMLGGWRKGLESKTLAP